MSKLEALITITSGHLANSQLIVNFDRITTAFDNTLSRDGCAPNQMETVIDMNSNRIINLASAVDDNDAVRKIDLDTLILGTGNVPGPLAGDVGKVLKATGVATYAWSSLVAAEISGLGTAATFDQGTLAGEIPTNGDLGTASLEDVGLLSGNVPQLSADNTLPVLSAVNLTNYPSATESLEGVAELSTQAEAEAGTNDTTVMTPLKTSQAIIALGGSSTAATAQIFTSSGTWNRPTGCTEIKVTVVGGGGGGGAANTAALTSAGTGGGGGGAAVEFIDVSATASATVTIGAGGAGAATGTSATATAGGTTSFGAFLSATGGGGGKAGGGVIGAGGVGTGGDLNFTGEDGISNYTDARTIDYSSRGGNSLLGIGGQRNTNPSAGNDGHNYGGGGAGTIGVTSGAPGGDGADGVILVEEYYD